MYRTWENVPPNMLLRCIRYFTHQYLGTNIMVKIWLDFSNSQDWSTVLIYIMSPRHLEGLGTHLHGLS